MPPTADQKGLRAMAEELETDSDVAGHASTDSSPPTSAPDGRSTAAATKDVRERFEAVRGSLHFSELETLLTRQTEAAAEVLGADSVGISMLLQDGMRVPLAASNEDAKTAEALQFTLGQGPCLDAFTEGRPILVADVTDASSRAGTIWPAYTEQLLARTPFTAVFAIPLASGGMSLGTLSMYRRRSGRLSEKELGDALAITHQIFFDLVDTGTFSGDVQPAFLWLNLPLARTRAVVWQAIGMLIVQHDLTTADALAVLRAYCYARDLLIDDVAAEIVRQTLPLDQLSP